MTKQKSGVIREGGSEQSDKGRERGILKKGNAEDEE
jgi:hypothetical protein